MDLFSDVSLPDLVSTIVYVIVGLSMFIGAYYALEKLLPFPVRKEIEEDQNIALSVIVGFMLLGLSIIIGAAIVSPSQRPQPRPAASVAPASSKAPAK